MVPLKASLAVSAALIALGLGACAPKSSGSSKPERGGVATLKSDGLTEAYRAYAIGQCNVLVTYTRAFAQALTAGNLDRAKRLYPSTRMAYERIEPIAEELGNLDPDIDGREGDVPAAQWRGFHRIERILWTGKEPETLPTYTTRLLDDVTLLRAKLDNVEITVSVLALGAVDLLNEVATSKITGEEERYSHTDLYDFAANVEGAREIFDLLEPQVKARDPALAATTEANFQKVTQALDRHRKGSDYALYTSLTTADTKALAQAVDALADPLSGVAALLGATK